MTSDAVQVLARRRCLFDRLTAERDAAPIGSAERATLEVATARCAQKLASCAAEVLRANAARRVVRTHDRPLPELEGALATASTLGKWRFRLTRELASLRAAAWQLDAASAALTHATADVFSDVPLVRTRAERKLVATAARTHCAAAAEALDAARTTAPFVRRALPAATSARLRNRGTARAAAAAAQPDVEHAARRLSEVVTACDDELVALTAAHAELDEAIMRASELQCAREAGRCDSMLQLPTLKRALCLLITLT